jgi:iron complex outermembrane receptor protein
MRSRAIRLAVACVVALLAASAPAGAQTATVSGTVTDTTGGVLVGASVTLRAASGTALQSSPTDGRGRYRLQNVAPGTYSLFVHKDGFGPLVEEVRVDADGVVRDWTLSPASFAEEVTVSFTGEHARTALKMDAAVKDIPLTVKSYTSSFVKALDIKTVNEMYTYMNGVNRTGDGVFDTSIRGFTGNQEANNMQMNGMPGFAARQSAPSISNVERIEVLKGPASVLYGRATPGGLVNIITKRPQADRQNVVDLRVGTFGGGQGPGIGDRNSYRVGGDFTGPIGSSNRVLYRFIASYDSIHSFRDFVDDTDLLIAPSLSFNLGTGTMLTIEAEYRDLDKSLDQQLIAPQNDIDFLAPINVRYQEPDDQELDKGTAVAAYFTKGFSGGTALNLTWRSVFHEDIRRGFENNRVEADNRRVRRRDRDQVNGREYHFLDATLNRRFGGGQVVHNVLFGLNGGFENRDFDRIRFGNVGFFVDLVNPVYGQYTLPADPRPGFHRLTELWSYAAYVQDRVDLGKKWKALLALRYDRLDTDLTELRLTNPPLSRSDDAFVPTVGLVFQPTPQVSLYGSFAKSFEPQAVTAVDVNGDNPFDPEEGRQYELGVKTEFARGKAEATAAFFDIVKSNVLVALGTGASEQNGEESSRGFEVDVRLQPLASAQAILGYTYTDAKVTEDNDPLRLGAQLINSARHSFNAWGRYDIQSGSARGLGFGLGLIYRGYRPGSFPNQVVRTGEPVPGQPVAQRVVDLPAYFRTDASLYFVKARYEITLKVTNLLDEKYYESAFNLLQVRPGRPREIGLSLRVGL